jgi:hypothetical protein
VGRDAVLLGRKLSKFSSTYRFHFQLHLIIGTCLPNYRARLSKNFISRYLKQVYFPDIGKRVDAEECEENSRIYSHIRVIGAFKFVESDEMTSNESVVNGNHSFIQQSTRQSAKL